VCYRPVGIAAMRHEPTRREFMGLVAAGAAGTPERASCRRVAGSRGYVHDDTKLKDKRPLNVRDLDQVSTEHPVVVRHRGGHTSFYNSRAFALAKIKDIHVVQTVVGGTTVYQG
jgi:predicted amidohydrolase YtcJ